MAEARPINHGQPSAPPPASPLLAVPAGGAVTATAPLSSTVREKEVVDVPWRKLNTSGTIVAAVSGAVKSSVTRQDPPTAMMAWSQLSEARRKRAAAVPVISTFSTLSVSVAGAAFELRKSTDCDAVMVLTAVAVKSSWSVLISGVSAM